MPTKFPVGKHTPGPRKAILIAVTNGANCYQDIMNWTDLSKSTVAWHVKRLVAHGLISREPGTRRTLRRGPLLAVVRDGAGVIREFGKVMEVYE